MSKNINVPSVLLYILTILSVLIRHDFVLAIEILPRLSTQDSRQGDSVSNNNPRLSIQVGSNSFSAPIVCSPDGSLAVTSHDDGVSKVWDLKTGGEIRRFSRPLAIALSDNRINGAGFTADGRTLFTHDENNIIRLWDIATGNQLMSFRGNKYDRSTGAALSPKGNKVLVGLGLLDATRQPHAVARLFDIVSRKEVRVFKGMSRHINRIAFSPDGRTFLTGEGPNGTYDQEEFKSGDVAARLWDVKSGKVIHRFKGHSKGVIALAYSKSGQIVATGSIDGIVKVWDFNSGKNLGTFSSENGRSITVIKISDDNSKLAVGGDNGQVTVRDIVSGKIVKSLILSDLRSKPQDPSFLFGRPLFELEQHPAAVSAFSHDWKLAFTTDTKVWDLETGSVRYILRSYSEAILTVGLPPDNRSVIVGRGDGQVQIWDLVRGRTLRKFGEKLKDDTFLSSERIKDIVISSDGETVYIFKRLLLPLYSSLSVGIWNIDEGKKISDFNGPKDSDTFSISQDGCYILAGSIEFMIGPAFAEMWDKSTGKKLQTIQTKGSSGITSIAISPDNKLIATGETRGWESLFDNNGMARLWDVSSGKEYKRFLGHSDSVVAIAFSPDGSALLTGSEDGTARLWRKQGGEIKRFTGHIGTVTSVAFSLDMQTVVTGGSDGSIRVWSVKNAKQLQRFESHSGSVASIKLSADGTKIASVGTDGSAMLWDIPTGRNLIRLLSMLDDTWVAITPDGRFDTNNLEGIKGLNWVMPDDSLHALPLEIFTRDFYEPQLLPRILKGNVLPALPPIAELNRVQPRVEKIAVVPQADNPDLVDVTVKVSSVPGQCLKGNEHIPCESGVYDLRLYRDQQLVGQISSVDISSINFGGSNWREQLQRWRKSNVVKTKDGYPIAVSTGPQEVTFTGIRLPQRSGISQVEFTAYAFNEDRVKSATSEPRVYPLGQPRPGVKRRAYVITVGVDATSDPSLRLSFAPNGARGVEELLRTKLASQYEVVPVQLISEYKKGSDELQQDLATKENIQTVLDLLSFQGGTTAQRRAFPSLKSATPDDLVILYLASHGYADPKGKFYMVPSDIGELGVSEELLDKCLKSSEQSSRCQAAQNFLHHTISSDELTRWLQIVDAGQMVVILDSCHSTAASGPNFKSGPMGDASFGQLSYDKGMLVLTATQAENLAWGTLELGGRSLLTEALINQQQEIELPFDLEKWLGEAEKQVPKLYQKFIHSEQRPFTSEGQQQQEPTLFNFARRSVVMANK